MATAGSLRRLRSKSRLAVTTTWTKTAPRSSPLGRCSPRKRQGPLSSKAEKRKLALPSARGGERFPSPGTIG